MSTDETEQTPLLAADRKPTTMSTSSETFWRIGAAYGAAAVALGAFGAHGLKKHIADPVKIANWSTAAQYQVCHIVLIWRQYIYFLGMLMPISSSTLSSCSSHATTPSPRR